MGTSCRSWRLGFVVVFMLSFLIGGLVKLEKMGCDLARVAEVLCKLVDFEGIQEAPKTSGDGGNGYVS